MKEGGRKEVGRMWENSQEFWFNFFIASFLDYTIINLYVIFK